MVPKVEPQENDDSQRMADGLRMTGASSAPNPMSRSISRATSTASGPSAPTNGQVNGARGNGRVIGSSSNGGLNNGGLSNGGPSNASNGRRVIGGMKRAVDTTTSVKIEPNDGSGHRNAKAGVMRPVVELTRYEVEPSIASGQQNAESDGAQHSLGEPSGVIGRNVQNVQNGAGSIGLLANATSDSNTKEANGSNVDFDKNQIDGEANADNGNVSTTRMATADADPMDSLNPDSDDDMSGSTAA